MSSGKIRDKNYKSTNWKRLEYNIPSDFLIINSEITRLPYHQESVAVIP
jgi:hypothetical protein